MYFFRGILNSADYQYIIHIIRDMIHHL